MHYKIGFTQLKSNRDPDILTFIAWYGSSSTITEFSPFQLNIVFFVGLYLSDKHPHRSISVPHTCKADRPVKKCRL